MNLSSPVVFWTLIVLLGLAGLVVLIIRNASQHRKGLVALAEELGFTYEPDSPELLEQFKDFRLFLPNPDRIHQSAFNVLKGKTGSATVWLFDYSYSIMNSKSPHDFTICALRSPKLKLPHFYLRHKYLTEMFGRSPAKKEEMPEVTRSPGSLTRVKSISLRTKRSRRSFSYAGKRDCSATLRF